MNQYFFFYKWSIISIGIFIPLCNSELLPYVRKIQRTTTPIPTTTKPSVTGDQTRLGQEGFHGCDWNFISNTNHLVDGIIIILHSEYSIKYFIVGSGKQFISQYCTAYCISNLYRVGFGYV